MYMKIKIEKQLNKIKNNLKNLYKDFRKNPKKTTLTLLNTMMEIIKNNTCKWSSSNRYNN